MWKDSQHHLILGRCKIKLQRDTTTHLLGWLRIQRSKQKQTKPRIDEDMEHWNSHTLLVGMQNGILEDNVVVSYKAKHPNHAIHQLSSLIFTQRSWKLCLHGNCHRPVYFNFIIAKTWKQPRYSLVRKWVNKLWTSREWNTTQN